MLRVILFLNAVLSFRVCEVLACETLSIEKRERAYLKKTCFFSKSLNKDVHYGLNVSPNYDKSKKTQALIFLHGRGASLSQFKHASGLSLLNKISKSTQTNTIVFSPEEPEHSYWKNRTDGFLMADAVGLDLVRHIKRRYGLDAEGLFGISMGGHGALYLGGMFSKTFKKVYAISPVFHQKEKILYMDKACFGENKKDFYLRDPVSLYRDQKGFYETDFFMEISFEDKLLDMFPLTRVFFEEMLKQAPQRVRMQDPGGHSMSYWPGAIRRALLFFAH